MDVVVTDHHQTDEDMPPAVAVINPHRAGARYPFRGLCSAALAYKVAQAYQLRYGVGGVPLESLLDLVALATIADVVPLHDENRSFVREGLAQIVAWSALRHSGVEASGRGDAGLLRRKRLPSNWPHDINAAGRLDDAMLGVRLLTTDNPGRGAAVGRPA